MALPFLRLPPPPPPCSLTREPLFLSGPSSSFSIRLSHSLNFFPKPEVKFSSLSTSFCATTAEAEPATPPTTSTGQETPKNRLIAASIPWDSTADDVKALFEKHGTVVNVELSMHNKVKNRGLAFVTMSSEEEASLAKKNLHSSEFGGRTLKVDYAKSPNKVPQPSRKSKTKENSVFVGNLSSRVKSNDLREFFNSELAVVSVQLIYNTKPHRRPAGFGFVSFNSKHDVELAISNFNGKELMGRPVTLGIAKGKEVNENKETNGELIENGNNTISQENIVNAQP